MTQNKNRQAIQTHHFMLELLFYVYCFDTVFLYFSKCHKQKNIEEQHIYSSFLNLIFMTS